MERTEYSTALKKMDNTFDTIKKKFKVMYD
jgi:hypothetical protein